jgi:hypothetical protein
MSPRGEIAHPRRQIKTLLDKLSTCVCSALKKSPDEERHKEFIYPDAELRFAAIFSL